MQFFVLENGLRTAAGHHLNNSLGLRQALLSRGVSTRFLINRRADPALVLTLDAAPCISFTPYDQVSDDVLCGEIESLHMQAGTIAAELSAAIGSGISSEDVLLVPTATQSEMLALAWMLQRLRPDRRPRVVLNFTRENFLVPASMALGSVAGLYRFAAKALRRCLEPGRCLLTSNSALMASTLSELLLHEVAVFPIPKAYPPTLFAAGGSRARTRKRVAVLGDMNEYKGFALIPALIDSLPDLDWLVQMPREGSAPHWGDRDDALRQLSNLELVPNGVSPERYYALFGDADIVLTPYDKRLRRMQTSGIFAEAVAAGKVVVAPASPWVIEHQLRRAWSGDVFESPTAQGIAVALSAVCENFAVLSVEAERKAAAWRQEQSVAAYVSRMFEWLGVPSGGVVE